MPWEIIHFRLLCCPLCQNYVFSLHFITIVKILFELGWGWPAGGGCRKPKFIIMTPVRARVFHTLTCLLLCCPSIIDFRLYALQPWPVLFSLTQFVCVVRWAGCWCSEVLMWTTVRRCWTTPPSSVYTPTWATWTWCLCCLSSAPLLTLRPRAVSRRCATPPRGGTWPSCPPSTAGEQRCVEHRGGAAARSLFSLTNHVAVTRWITWIRTASARWFTQPWGATWRWWSSSSIVTGEWDNSSSSHLRPSSRQASPRARRLNRHSSLLPVWDIQR